jgi:hypothetical protein
MMDRYMHAPAPVPHRRRAAAMHRSVAMAMLLAMVAMLTGGATQREPDKDTTAMIQASYIYNIAKLVEWQDGEMHKGPFIIGVLGSANLYQELVKKYSSRSIGRQPIEVRKLPETVEVDRCHILFVPEEDKALLQGILKQPNTGSTLIVTDFLDALDHGAVVNFIAARNTLKYEISIANARRQHIEVGLTLRQLAERVVE